MLFLNNTMNLERAIGGGGDVYKGSLRGISFLKMLENTFRALI